MVVGAVSVSAKGAERVTLVCSEEMQMEDILEQFQTQPCRHARDYCYGSLPIVSQSSPCLSHPHSPILVRTGSSKPPSPLLYYSPLT